MGTEPPSGDGETRKGRRRLRKKAASEETAPAPIVIGDDVMPDLSALEPPPQISEPPAAPVTAPLPQRAPIPPPEPQEIEPPSPGQSVLIALGPSGIEGVPARYDDGTQWLRNGLGRHTEGTWVALLAGWTGLWIALWGAAFGLIVGAFVAGGFGLSLGYRFGIGQAAGALGVVAGGITGIAYGFLGVLRFLYVQHPIQAVISIASGAIIAVVIVVAVAAFERLGLRLRGYRRLSRTEVRKIAPLVKDAADGMDLAALPRFAMADILVPNAWTHMRTIVITTGLLQTVNDKELRAVLAHELEHWRQGDAVGLHFVWAAAWPVALIYNLGTMFAGQQEEGGGPPRRSSRGFLAFVGWLIAWPTWVIIKLVITPVIASSQRRYEYGADAAAAKIGYAADLSSALRKMGAFEGGRTGWEQAMTATHPPTELRLEALEPPKPDDSEYQEDELRAPTGEEVRRLFRFWKRSSTNSPT